MDPLLDHLAGLLAGWSTVPADVVTRDTDLEADLGIDSLTRLELPLAFRRELGVVVDDTELFKARTVGDVLALLGDRSGEAQCVDDRGQP